MLLVRPRWSLYRQSVKPVFRPVQAHRRALQHVRYISFQVTTSQDLPSTCSCASTPAGLAIDREKPLKKTVPPYTRHIVLCTGKSDWTSKIDDDPCVEPIIKRIREGLSRLPGRTLITASSFSMESRLDSKEPAEGLHGLRIFPEGHEYTWYRNRPAGLDKFFEYLQNRSKNPNAEMTSISNYQRLDSNSGNGLYWRSSPCPTILTCSHNSRDSRCGVLGPLLYSEFRREIALQNQTSANPRHVDTGMISHVGGHAFAGNVILYFPTFHPLAGCGLWYGRVEPKHVEGILEATVRKGIIIKDLFRGGITQDGEPMDLPHVTDASETEWKATAKSRG